MTSNFDKVISGKSEWPRVVGRKRCLCDATLEHGEQYVVDFDFYDEEHIMLYLSHDALRGVLTYTLSPSAWLRLATRMSPDYFMLDGANYTLLGQAFALDSSLITEDYIDANIREDLLNKLSNSVDSVVAFGIVGEEDDVFKLHGCGLPSMATWIQMHGQKRCFESIDMYSARTRQVEEILGRLDQFAQCFLEPPDPEWLRHRWACYGTRGFSSLIPLSLVSLPWDEVLALAREAAQNMDVRDRVGNSLGWGDLVKLAPPRMQEYLQNEYLSLIPESKRDLALIYMSQAS